MKLVHYRCWILELVFWYTSKHTMAGHQKMHAFSFVNRCKFSIYEDFLRMCGIKEIRPVLLITVYSKINRGEV